MCLHNKVMAAGLNAEKTKGLLGNCDIGGSTLFSVSAVQTHSNTVRYGLDRIEDSVISICIVVRTCYSDILYGQVLLGYEALNMGLMIRTGAEDTT